MLLLDKNDPLYKCNLYKDKGCSHIDGILCDYKTCSMRLEYEMFQLEQELNIPTNLRYYNKNKK